MSSIDHALINKIQEAEPEFERPSTQEVEKIIRHVLESLSSGISLQEITFYLELEKLHDFIEKAKEEIRGLRPDEIHDAHLPQAHDELSAVVRATEEATGKILDAAELIEQVADSLEGEQKERLSAATTAIYEASNFQDITGQRITKVTTALRHIDEKISSLLNAFSANGQKNKTTNEPELPAVSSPQTDDKNLLNGPQLPENAHSQEDIDALFDDL